MMGQADDSVHASVFKHYLAKWVLELLALFE
jgi:hypothetical protein